MSAESELDGRLKPVVDTLLQVADLIVRVSPSLEISSIWHKDKAWGNTTSAHHEFTAVDLIGQCQGQILDGFGAMANGSHFIRIVNANKIACHLAVKVLFCIPDSEDALVLFEYLEAVPLPGNDGPPEKGSDYVSDGFWEADLDTGLMEFSENWQQTFGYAKGEIATADEWREKLHTDDVFKADLLMESALKRLGDRMKTELRYRCKNGNYKWLYCSISDLGPGRRGVLVVYLDIDFWKKEEEKYPFKANFLNNLLNHLHCGILVADEHRNIVFFNEQFFGKYNDGTRPNIKGLNLREWLEFSKTNFKDPDAHLARIKQLQENGIKVLGDEIRLLSGKVFKRDYLPLNVNGVFKGEIWQFNDVSAQSQSEAQILAQREFFESVLNNIPANVAVISADGQVLFANSGSNWDAGVPGVGPDADGAGLLQSSVDALAAVRKVAFDAAVNDNKQICWIEEKESNSGATYTMRFYHPLLGDADEVSRVIAYGINVTDLMETQLALRTSMETFSAAFNGCGLSMAIVGPDCDYLDVNAEFCSLTGYTRRELLSMNSRDITLPEDIDIDRPQVDRLLAQEIASYTIEKRIISRSDRIVLIALTVSLVRNADGSPKFFVSQMVDITEKRLLENEVFRKNISLESTRDNLVNKIEQLEELNKIIAHNLRGPVRNIEMFAKVLRAKLIGDADGLNPITVEAFTLDESLDFIGMSCKSLTECLETLLEVTQIKLNNELLFDDCIVPDLVNELVGQLHGVIFEKRADIRLHLEVEVIKYPRVYLESILYNFISNALKYSKPEVPPVITIKTFVEGDRTALSVMDNGLGLDIKKYGKKVFLLNQVFHEGYDSKGIGLYITKTQVESLGGKVEVKSAVNEGSEFVVWF